MPHGERAKRISDHCGRDYWGRRHGNDSLCRSVPKGGHHDPKSPKRMTRRAERRKSRQENPDA